MDMHTKNYQETKSLLTFKIITLLIQKKKKSNRNTQYDIIISDLKWLRIRQALGRRLLSRRGYYWEWERKGRGIWHFDWRKREVLVKCDVWDCEGSVCIYVRLKLSFSWTYVVFINSASLYMMTLYYFSKINPHGPKHKKPLCNYFTHYPWFKPKPKQ